MRKGVAEDYYKSPLRGIFLFFPRENATLRDVDRFTVDDSASDFALQVLISREDTPA